MRKKCSLKLFVFALLLFFGGLGIVGADEAPGFQIKIKSNGAISFQTLGINGAGMAWGTEKFSMTIDDGATEYIIYCLNNDLYTRNELLNTNLSDFDHLYNHETIKKVLYYGYGGPGYDEKDKDKVMNDPEYKIWMPINGEWISDAWTDDLLYCLTHLALSYAYYHDVMNLSEEEAVDRAFYLVAQSPDSYGSEGTRARSVAKLWYETLVAKPSVGIKLSSENHKSITYSNSGVNNPLSINFNEKITISGNDVSTGGRIEFVVPADVNCIVTGDITGATASGTYSEGTKLTLGSGQTFAFRLAKDVKKVENLHINFYENYSIAKVDGGVNEEGTPYQDLAGLYPSGDNALAIELQFAGPYDYTNPETGAFVPCIAIISGLVFASVMVVISMKNKKFNKV